ncbi:MAG: hypothetical protein M3R24_22090 [Chloroflexota bacterium]|nr:hypothetical protein [Chloroflexota bacterium]PLS79044.1 MAG: hypothetical protein CYG59_15370 [Chloroflexota bacterium]
MWPLQDEWQVQARQHDLLAHAEQQQRIALALASKPRRSARYAPVLLWLGRHLSTWGLELQTRYQPQPMSKHSCNM